MAVVIASMRRGTFSPKRVALRRMWTAGPCQVVSPELAKRQVSDLSSPLVRSLASTVKSARARSSAWGGTALIDDYAHRHAVLL